jgi:hypothetical protein
VKPFAPTSEGFRLVFRQPAIPFAEIAWRWTIVAAAWVLGAILALEWIDSRPVSPLDRLLLASGEPILVSRAIARIFRGALFSVTGAAVLLGLALTLAWILLASFGRAATVDAVHEEFGAAPATSRRGSLSSLIALNFMRSALALAALTGAVGAALIAGSFRSSTHLSLADSSRLLVLIVFLVWLAWCALNWLLSTAAIVLWIEGGDMLAAMVSTLRLCQQKPGPVFATTAFFALLHLGALTAACLFGVLAFVALGALRPGQVLLLELAIALLYCAVADFLHAARMAAYVFIIRQEEILDLRGHPGARPQDSAGHLAHIDRSELILSDVPFIA